MSRETDIVRLLGADTVADAWCRGRVIAERLRVPGTARHAFAALHAALSLHVKLGGSRARLAEHAGVSGQTLRDYLKGKRTLPASVFAVALLDPDATDPATHKWLWDTLAREAGVGDRVAKPVETELLEAVCAVGRLGDHRRDALADGRIDPAEHAALREDAYALVGEAQDVLAATVSDAG